MTYYLLISTNFSTHGLYKHIAKNIDEANSLIAKIYKHTMKISNLNESLMTDKIKITSFSNYSMEVWIGEDTSLVRQSE